MANPPPPAPPPTPAPPGAYPSTGPPPPEGYRSLSAAALATVGRSSKRHAGRRTTPVVHGSSGRGRNERDEFFDAEAVRLINEGEAIAPRALLLAREEPGSAQDAAHSWRQAELLAAASVMLAVQADDDMAASQWEIAVFAGRPAGAPPEDPPGEDAFRRMQIGAARL